MQSKRNDGENLLVLARCSPSFYSGSAGSFFHLVRDIVNTSLDIQPTTRTVTGLFLDCRIASLFMMHCIWQAANYRINPQNIKSVNYQLGEACLFQLLLLSIFAVFVH